MILGRVLTRTATRWPENEALVQGERRLTYRELQKEVRNLVGGLQSLGIESGDAVGLYTANSIEQIVSYLAVQSIGAVAVATNPRLAAGELSTIMNDAGVETIICDPGRAPTVGEAYEEGRLPDVEHRIATGEFDDMLAYEDLVNQGPAGAPDGDVRPEDPGIMMHTSGTTGRPKLVVISHRSQVLNSLSCAVELDFGPGDRVLHIAPLNHSAGYLNLFLPCLQLGGTHVLEPSFDPERTLRRIESEGVTVTLGVPTHFQLLRAADIDAERFDTDSLRLLITSGAPVHRTIADWVSETLCANFWNVYGLTETTGLVTVTEEIRRDDSGAYCIGKPFLDAEIRLIDPGDDVPPDRTVEPGERGQLIVRSAKLMEEYYGRPERTAETIRDGWLYTGDVAVERDGIYYLIDRLDNRIISGGENIYPQEIERVLGDHPAVEDCAMVGAPDETLGKRVVAYVVTDDDSLNLAAIDEFWKERSDIADFKRPREVRLVDTIPRNQSGKILRNELPDQ